MKRQSCVIERGRLVDLMNRFNTKPNRKGEQRQSLPPSYTWINQDVDKLQVGNILPGLRSPLRKLSEKTMLKMYSKKEK